MYSRFSGFRFCYILVTLLLAGTAHAQLSSTNYQVSVLGAGEISGTGTSTNFTVENAAGSDFAYTEPAVETSSGGSGSRRSTGDTETESNSEPVTTEQTPTQEPVERTDVPIVPATVIAPTPSEIDTVESETQPEEVVRIQNYITSLLTSEDEAIDSEKLALVLDRQVYILSPNTEGQYQVTASFENDGQVEVIVPASALGITTSELLTIVIVQKELDPSELPHERYQPVLFSGHLYEIRIFNDRGEELTAFNDQLQIVIVLPNSTSENEDIGVYFINEMVDRWEQVSNVTFIDREALFSIDHLTTFGVWETNQTPEVMEFDDSNASLTEETPLATSTDTARRFLNHSLVWILILPILFLGFKYCRSRFLRKN